MGAGLRRIGVSRPDNVQRPVGIAGASHQVAVGVRAMLVLDSNRVEPHEAERAALFLWEGVRGIARTGGGRRPLASGRGASCPDGVAPGLGVQRLRGQVEAIGPSDSPCLRVDADAREV
jgi:hypothetical protein